MRTHHVLVGMSAGETADRDGCLAFARSVGASLAFLQLASPGLSSELTRLADAGAERIVLVGLGRSRTGPGVSWLRRVAAEWWRSHAQPPEVLTAPRLVAGPDEWEAAVATARPVAGTEPGLRSAAWDEIPGHRHQVFVCRGPRCTAAGAEQSNEALILALMEHGLGDDDVLLTQTGCQFPCNNAPVVSVQPDDVWYGQVSPAAAERVVSEHLVAGDPVSEHRLARAIRLTDGSATEV